MAMLYGRPTSRRDLAAHGQTAQAGGITLMTLADGPARGTRVLEVRTAAGLRFTVLPDRAFDIHDCDVQGRGVAWHSPVGVRNPALHEPEGEGGLGWTRSFSGLLATCGLDHFGFMERDTAAHYGYPARQVVEFGLHGRIANTPGRLVGYGEAWDGDSCTLYIEGEVRQAAVFAENLVLRRRIEVALDGSTITICDRVSNAGFAPTPHMILYHVNLGFPVIAEGSRYLAPITATEWASHAADLRRQGVGYRTVPGPRHPFTEQVWSHRMLADAQGLVPVAVLNDVLGHGVLLETRQAELPVALQWQCFQAGLYAMGIEPASNHPQGNAFARERGELTILQHGEHRDYTLRFTVLAGAEALRGAEARIRAVGGQPDDDYPEPTGVLAALA
jgi:hypothetical protein